MSICVNKLVHVSPPKLSHRGQTTGKAMSLNCMALCQQIKIVLNQHVILHHGLHPHWLSFFLILYLASIGWCYERTKCVTILNNPILCEIFSLPSLRIKIFLKTKSSFTHLAKLLLLLELYTYLRGEANTGNKFFGMNNNPIVQGNFVKKGVNFSS